jgi:hypothetical protein
MSEGTSVPFIWSTRKLKNGAFHLFESPCFFCFIVLLLILLKKLFEDSMQNNQFYYILPILMFVLSACSGESTKFLAGDMKKDFCGTHLNYQYCECAFSGIFCEQVVMNKSEANAHVETEYNNWVGKERQIFAKKCESDGGLFENDECKYCQSGKKYQDGKCRKTVVENKEEGGVDMVGSLPEGGCRQDGDCISECQGNVMKKMTCNLKNNTCEKSTDLDCTSNLESFGDLKFSMTCMNGECLRDATAIQEKRAELQSENDKYLKERQAAETSSKSLNKLIAEADKNCLGELVDSSDSYYSELASSVDSFLLDKTIQPISLSKEKLGEYLDKLFSYNKGERQSFLNGEFKELSCELFNYFKIELDKNKLILDELKIKIESMEATIEKLPV